MSAIDRLIQGSIDIHVHFGPDPRVERRADVWGVAQSAKDLGMRAVVLKSHEYSTAAVAATVQVRVPEVLFLGAVSLDDEVGGLNVRAIEATARMGGRVVWFPTFSAAADREHRNLLGGISTLDENGAVTPVARECLAAVKEYDMTLCTGHIGVQECLAVVKAAREIGVRRVVITHVSTLDNWYRGGFPLEAQQELIGMGAFLEHAFNICMPMSAAIPVKKVVGMVRAVGAEHCILSTDFGQAHHPLPAEGFRMAIASLLMAGMNEMEVSLMVKDNPARVLGL